MTSPQNALNVELAQFGGVDLKSSSQLVTYISLIGTFCAGTFGHDWGIARNAQTIAYAAFAVIAAAHLLSRAIHHKAVEAHNSNVKVATIAAAVEQNKQVEASSPTQLVGPSDVVVEPNLPAQPASSPPADVAAGFPVETVSSTTLASADASVAPAPTAAGLPVQ